MDMPYFWFFINNRRFGFYLFVNDIKLYFFGILDFLNCLLNIDVYFKNNQFYYWYNSSNLLSNTQYRKHNIRDLFVLNLSVLK